MSMGDAYHPHKRDAGRGPAAHFQEDDVLSLSTPADITATRAAGVTGGATKPTADGILRAVLSSLDGDKAEEIVKIDLRGKSEIGDYMVIASGRSTRQVTAMAEKLTERVKAEFGVVSKLEGKETGDWVLIDTGDVIVHIFRPEVREFYQLEKMWIPAQSAADAHR